MNSKTKRITAIGMLLIKAVANPFNRLDILWTGRIDF